MYREDIIRNVPDWLKSSPRWVPLSELKESLSDSLLSFVEAADLIGKPYNGQMVHYVGFVVGDGWGRFEFAAGETIINQHFQEPAYIEKLDNDQTQIFGIYKEKAFADSFSIPLAHYVSGRPYNSADVLTVHTVQKKVEPSFTWEPLESRLPSPAFPLFLIPEWLSDHIVSFSKTTGISIDYCAASALGAISSVAVGHCDIPFNGTHKEPIQLYSVFCGPSGSMKSAAIKHFLAPVHEYTRANNEQVKRDNARIGYQIEEKENDLKKEKSKNTRDQKRIESLIEELRELRKDHHNSFPVPLDDITPEALTNSLKYTRGTANIASSEGNIINVLTGRSYNQRGSTPNLDTLLKGFDGESVHSYRVTTGELDIERVDISMIVAIQPSLLENLCKSPDAVGRGLAQRFLIYAPEDTEQSIDYTDYNEMDPAYIQRWSEHVKHIAARFMDPDLPAKLMPLEPDADLVIRKFWNYENDLKKEYKDDEEAILGWISKLHGKALRVAAILALLRDRDSVTISKEDADKAVLLFKLYYIPMFIGSYVQMDNLTKEQHIIINWLVRKNTETGLSRFNQHDITQDLRQRSSFSGSDGTQRFNIAREGLIQRHYIRLIKGEAPSGGGRAPLIWEVNPEVFEERC